MAAVLLGLGLAATPAPEPAGGTAGSGEPELTVAAEVPRMAHAPRTVNVLVSNHGPEPVLVRGVELVTDSFVPTGPVDKDVVVPAGGARALAVGYGQAHCQGEASPPLAPATARLLVGPEESAAGGWREVALPHPDRQLELLLHRECAATRVQDVVTLAFAGWSQGAEGRLYGHLSVERRSGDEAVSIYDVSGNVLIKLTVDASAPARPVGTLPPGQQRLEIPVVADANRCDPHAVAEAKQRELLRAWVSVGDDENLPVTVAVDQDSLAQLEQMVLRRCGL